MIGADEVIKWKGSPNRFAALFSPALLVTSLLGAAAAHPLVAQSMLAAASPFLDVGGPAGLAVAHGIPALLGAKALWMYVLEATTQYILTDERLVVRRGVFVRVEDEVELYRVIDAVDRVSLLQRIIGVGTVEVSSTDQTGTVLMRSIRDSGRIRRGVRHLAEECKNKRGRVRILE